MARRTILSNAAETQTIGALPSVPGVLEHEQTHATEFLNITGALPGNAAAEARMMQDLHSSLQGALDDAQNPSDDMRPMAISEAEGSAPRADTPSNDNGYTSANISAQAAGGNISAGAGAPGASPTPVAPVVASQSFGGGGGGTAGLAGVNGADGSDGQLLDGTLLGGLLPDALVELDVLGNAADGTDGSLLDITLLNTDFQPGDPLIDLALGGNTGGQGGLLDVGLLDVLEPIVGPEPILEVALLGGDNPTEVNLDGLDDTIDTILLGTGLGDAVQDIVSPPVQVVETVVGNVVDDVVAPIAAPVVETVVTPVVTTITTVLAALPLPVPPPPPLFHGLFNH